MREQQQVGLGAQFVERFFQRQVRAGDAAVDEHRLARTEQQPRAEEFLKAGTVQRQSEQEERFVAAFRGGTDVDIGSH